MANVYVLHIYYQVPYDADASISHSIRLFSTAAHAQAYVTGLGREAQNINYEIDVLTIDAPYVSAMTFASQ